MHAGVVKIRTPRLKARDLVLGAPGEDSPRRLFITIRRDEVHSP